MSLERGTRPGGPRTEEPPDNGKRIAIAAVFVAAALVLTILLAVGALAPGAAPSAVPGATPTSSLAPTAEPTTEPSAEPSNEPTPEVTSEPTLEPTPEASPEPSVEPSLGPSVEPTPEVTPEPTARPTPTPEPTPPATARPTPTPEATARPTPRATPRPTPRATPRPTPRPGDPEDLPRYPGSRLIRRDPGRSGDLATVKLEYTTPAALDRVRQHYRRALRQHRWFVGNVEFDDDEWEIEANRGRREVHIEIERDDGVTEVLVELSYPGRSGSTQRGSA